MKMYTQSFNTMRGLNEYVNENHISQDSIVTIYETNDGIFLLIYYAD